MPLFLCSFLRRIVRRGSLSYNCRAKVFTHPGKVKALGFAQLNYRNNAEGASSVFRCLKTDIRPLTRIRSAQWVFGSKLTGEPAYKNPQGSGKIK